MKVVPAVLAADATLDLATHGAAHCRSIVSTFAAGARVPDEGTSVHDITEISLVLSGSFDLDSGGECRRLAAGDLVVVPPGEPHFFHVRETTRIFTLTIGDA